MMRSPWFLVALLAVGLPQLASSQDTYPKSGKDIKLRTTELAPVDPPKVTPKPGDPAPGPADTYPERGEAKGTILKADQWSCGRQFTDEHGTRWTLVAGPGETNKPDRVAGWIMRAQNDRLVFVSSTTGSVYVPRAQHPGVMAVPAAPLPVGLMQKLIEAGNPPKK